MGYGELDECRQCPFRNEGIELVLPPRPSRTGWLIDELGGGTVVLNDAERSQPAVRLAADRIAALLKEHRVLFRGDRPQGWTAPGAVSAAPAPWSSGGLRAAARIRPWRSALSLP